MQVQALVPETAVNSSQKLIMSGTGQVRAGHFVTAFALTFGLTLNYLFTGEANGRSWNEMAYRVIRYFEDNETGMQ